MREQYDAALAPLTTLRLGGPARRLVEVDTESELLEVVGDADDANEPLLVLGGGSNVVVADNGFAGTVVRVRTRGVDIEADASGASMVTVAAGEEWDPFVRRAVDEQWVGVEALSGIPGLAGAVPIQNVGAYGQEVAQTIASVRTYDREERRLRTFSAADCGFAYRTSRFKQSPGRHLILSVTFRFALGELSAPVRYAELARRLGVEQGERAKSADVREAVLTLRRGKGMVLDEHDHDTWSAGSFFTNPILSAEDAASLPGDAPRFPESAGQVKTSAAWLIDHAGFSKGYGEGNARLSGKHVLALTNRGGATTAEVLDLAREIRDGVRAAYDVTLHNEPVLVGVDL